MKKKKITLEGRQKAVGLIFILPWVVGFLLFFVYNFVLTFVFSFNKMTINDGGGYSLQYIGVDNFDSAIHKSTDFLRQLTQSVGSMMIDVPLIIFFSLFVAVLLNRKFKGRAFVRAVFFLPVIMACPAITQALSDNMNNIMSGLASTSMASETKDVAGLNIRALTEVLSNYGIPNQIVDYLVGAVSRLYEIVRNSGVQIIVFLAALQAIPGSMYEVAQIEGATGYETFWKITFPLVSPLILTNVVYTLVDLYSQSEIITLEQTTAFSQMNFGLSSAMCVISSALVCAIIGICAYLISRKVFYQA